MNYGTQRYTIHNRQDRQLNPIYILRLSAAPGEPLLNRQHRVQLRSSELEFIPNLEWTDSQVTYVWKFTFARYKLQL